ncbi:hypothetical protein [Niabella sp.]|uniref:hypothetical protein n=1 Tax=Niabella sp. TaxID=1962976 RepID=UPI002611172B|nr:hypothetical protein [Niabella sp.]
MKNDTKKIKQTKNNSEMTTPKITATNYYPNKKLVVTHISGELEKTDVEQWAQSFKDRLEQLADNSTFKIFINMYGFKAANIDAHKRFRGVVPLTLAGYGWKEGYLDLFEEEARTITYRNIRGIKCVGAAHAHQDETKMDLYETKFSSNNEHFFPDPAQARQWIENLEISN